MNPASKSYQVFNEAKNVFDCLGLPVIEKEFKGDSFRFSTGVIRINNGPPEIIAVEYLDKRKYLIISDTLCYPVKMSDKASVLEIVNKLNRLIGGSKFCLDEEDKVIVTCTGFWLGSLSLDKTLFERNLKYLMSVKDLFFPIIYDFLKGAKDKKEVMDQLNKIKKEAEKNDKESKKGR